MERFTAPAGVVLMLIKEVGGKKQVLLQRRKNTGFADGLLDLSCSGHVEKDEVMSDTVLRECTEELGLSLKKSDLRFVCFIHKRDGDKIYYYGYFVCDKFESEPKIMESDKCSQLIWADLNNLPADVIPDRIEAVKAYLNGTHYLEYGWE
ncbi:MAG: NUDIX domain-containing protein [Clostridia bacterium]|nr:NUDIX domain-containing protein [Clostridia bacterium]